MSRGLGDVYKRQVGEDPGTLEDVYEPYLLQCGLMIRTPQGRQATLRTFEHLGIEPTV